MLLSSSEESNQRLSLRWAFSSVREDFLRRKFVPRSLFVPLGFLLNSLLRSHRRSGLHFLCREKVTKSGRGAPRAPVQGDSHPAGGARAEGLLRKARPFGAGRPSRGDQSPHVPPCPPGGFQFPQPGGRRKLRACGGHPAPARPLFAAESGLTFPPWVA